MEKSFIYCIRASDGRIKIGHSVNPGSRLMSLQIGHPDPLEILWTISVPWERTEAIEDATHKSLSEYHIRGEWFSVCPDIARKAVESNLSVRPSGKPIKPLNLRKARNAKNDHFVINWDHPGEWLKAQWSLPIFANRAQAGIWRWMLVSFAVEDGKPLDGKTHASIRRGEMLIAEREIAEDFGLTRATLRSLLSRMEQYGLITVDRKRVPPTLGKIIRCNQFDRIEALGVLA